MIKLMKIIGITLLLNFVSLLVGMPYSNASDYNSILKGEYVFTGNHSCAWGGFGNGFNPNLSRDANGYESSANVQGVLILPRKSGHLV
jgi:hypothetical protein